jgi:hypothetical protein
MRLGGGAASEDHAQDPTAFRSALRPCSRRPAAQPRCADPAGSSPLLAALTWVQGTLLGNLATTAAVIAVAIIGYMMLTAASSGGAGWWCWWASS